MWVTKSVEFQKHDDAMTSSERFSLDKDRDKMNISLPVGKLYDRDMLTT